MDLFIIFEKTKFGLGKKNKAIHCKMLTFHIVEVSQKLMYKHPIISRKRTVKMEAE